jgi:hypothetical protein
VMEVTSACLYVVRKRQALLPYSLSSQNVAVGAVPAVPGVPGIPVPSMLSAVSSRAKDQGLPLEAPGAGCAARLEGHLLVR